MFVFAITQVSHLLLDHLTWAGAGQSLLALLVVWWSWNYTTWVTNELDPESIAVRMLLIAVMLASLLMAVGIPEAFGERALLFAGSYVAIQVGRHLFLAFARRTRDHRAGARAAHPDLVHGGGRAVDRRRARRRAGARHPVAGRPRARLRRAALRLPGAGLPAAREAAWNVGTEHFAERFQLFIIIALGETIVITGATTSDLDLDPGAARRVRDGVPRDAALWWLYFNYVARIAQRRLELSETAPALPATATPTCTSSWSRA